MSLRVFSRGVVEELRRLGHEPVKIVQKPGGPVFIYDARAGHDIRALRDRIYQKYTLPVLKSEPPPLNGRWVRPVTAATA